MTDRVNSRPVIIYLHYRCHIYWPCTMCKSTSSPAGRDDGGCGKDGSPRNAIIERSWIDIWNRAFCVHIFAWNAAAKQTNGYIGQYCSISANGRMSNANGKIPKKIDIFPFAERYGIAVWKCAARRPAILGTFFWQKCTYYSGFTLPLQKSLKESSTAKTQSYQGFEPVCARFLTRCGCAW